MPATEALMELSIYCQNWKFKANVRQNFTRLCCLVPVAFKTSSGLGPPLIRGLAHFPQPYSSPPHSYCPAAASMRPPPLTTRQRAQCTISMMRVVSHCSHHALLGYGVYAVMNKIYFIANTDFFNITHLFADTLMPFPLFISYLIPNVPFK